MNVLRIPTLESHREDSDTEWLNGLISESIYVTILSRVEFQIILADTGVSNTNYKLDT